jgi:signal peptidase I
MVVVTLWIRNLLCPRFLTEEYTNSNLSPIPSTSPAVPSEPSHKLLTKGDNNIADDTELYAQGQSYLDRKEDIVGSVRGYIPGVGYVTIMLSEHPWLKTALLGIMGLMVILQRE